MQRERPIQVMLSSAAGADEAMSSLSVLTTYRLSLLQPRWTWTKSSHAGLWRPCCMTASQVCQDRAFSSSCAKPTARKISSRLSHRWCPYRVYSIPAGGTANPACPLPCVCVTDNSSMHIGFSAHGPHAVLLTSASLHHASALVQYAPGQGEGSRPPKTAPPRCPR